MPRLALHLVWGCYGFWLPNDPRGSWSTYVGSRDVYDAGGRATTVNTRRSLAGDQHDTRQRLSVKAALPDRPVRLTGEQAREVALGIAAARANGSPTLLALCVMPDHVHVVVAGGSEDAKFLIGRFKSFATKRLNAYRLSPRGTGTPWSRGGWFVSLGTDAAVRRTIAYVNDNPVKAGLRPQRWSFVRPWEEESKPRVR